MWRSVDFGRGGPASPPLFCWRPQPRSACRVCGGDGARFSEVGGGAGNALQKQQAAEDLFELAEVFTGGAQRFSVQARRADQGQATGDA